ncbi:hypothetical protein AB0C93_24455 [Streptomyces sp. NPDC048518]
MVNGRERYRVRRPNRSRPVEALITTGLIALVTVSFSTALYAVLSRS